MGPDTTAAEAQRNLRRYYAFTGRADEMASGLLTTSQQIRDAISAFDDIGADEVMLYCWSTDPDQVGRIGDVVF